MSDIFDTKNIKPMLIGVEQEPFDSPDYIFELKLDGERCIAYLDNNSTELRNKRNLKLLPRFPELSDIHKQIKTKCILDGELAVISNGKPDFYEVQRRSLMSNKLKIELASKQHPACFTAFDILYYEDHLVTDKPLMERKALLQSVFREENSLFAYSRYIEEKGSAFYQLTTEQDLEGIVAKRKDSKYYFDKRTKDWIKIKNYKDDDFVVCGYILKPNNVSSIVIGQYRNSELVYKGHVTLGVGGDSFREIMKYEKRDSHPFSNPVPSGNEDAVWLEPIHVCVVKFMDRSENGMRHPVFKGLRSDKSPTDCVDKST
jgi:bifunctional non-homologous end joining protein LigD